jgi:hypothetical protein
MSIRKWHAGKLMILWAWGGVFAAVLLTSFLSQPVRSTPWLHLFELAACLLILILLSIVTWRWLSGKES